MTGRREPEKRPSTSASNANNEEGMLRPREIRKDPSAAKGMADGAEREVREEREQTGTLLGKPDEVRHDERRDKE